MPKDKNSKASFKDNEDRIDHGNMTDTDIEEWIVTTRKVLIVLNEEDNKAYEKVYQEFVLDMQHLLDNGRITDIDYEEILDNL